MAGEITNEQLLREIRGIGARVGDLMRRVQQLDQKVTAASSKSIPVESKRNNRPSEFRIQNTK